MPIADPAEARDVDRLISRALNAGTLTESNRALQSLFLERLDFNIATGSVPLRKDGLPEAATRLAARDGVHVVGLQVLERGRVLKQSLDLALTEIRRALGEDVLLLATDADRGQWHFVYPGQEGGRAILRRMVAYRGQGFRTVAEQFSGIYRDLQQGLDIRTALDRAYDVEAVTKRFFQEYARIFAQVMRQIKDGLPDEEERKLFCQTLFNRLMFLYFLQRKGWLRFNGRIDYLDALWDDARKQPQENVYESRLKLLFFTALSNVRDANWDNVRYALEPVIGQVPFLNGGLFTPQAFDERHGVVVPNEAIQLILRDLFAQFNFTVTESTPYDQEVAVDPEMLGKVFEELVTGRHETGSYYTPRPVVAFMCREALKGFLCSQLPDLPEVIAAAFVDDRDVTSLTVQQARKIIEALEIVTAVDPACGSGAYLLGMLHELVELQQLLYSSSLLHDAKSLYDLKLRIIERNLYGPDIDQFAVNIAMLRLWLSLAIEYDGPQPEPLPNLDYKIVCGDSLSEPSHTTTTDLFAHVRGSLIAELWTAKSAFLRATGEEKRIIRARIQSLMGEMQALHGTAYSTNGVNWPVHFAEVFARAGGFDIVIANPPYLFGESLGAASRLKPSDYRLAKGQFEAYWLFHERSLTTLLQPAGMHCFINSDALLARDETQPLRQFLYSALESLEVSHVGMVFEGVGVSAVVLI